MILTLPPDLFFTRCKMRWLKITRNALARIIHQPQGASRDYSRISWSRDRKGADGIDLTAPSRSRLH